ncbi:MAG: hypothetical protein ACRC4N_00615 [Gammaproteobacteria bacterium]
MYQLAGANKVHQKTKQQQKKIYLQKKQFTLKTASVKKKNLKPPKDKINR